ncbi:MAG: alpha-amylase [Chloroflexi bacterium]|nr:MAG: alpha-amylase [Chloroflexota bacterium]
MKSIVLYLQVHQPYRLRPYTVFETGEAHDYFTNPVYETDANNEFIFQKVADKSYRPMNALLLKLLNDHPEFKLSLSISGVFLEQAQQWAPDVIDSFRQLVATGRVELLSETYYHSLAFFYDRREFEQQVQLHRDKIREVFGVETKVFRNTELAYNDEVGQWAEANGFAGVLAEGWDPILEWRSPNYVYRPQNTTNTGLLLKNYQLSDDIAFRFSDQAWTEWPLKTDKYRTWVADALAGNNQLVNLFMDYETFGEHQWKDTGIFDFFEDFVASYDNDSEISFATTSEALAIHQPVGELPVAHTTTWADSERDLSAWTGNNLQQEALKYLYAMQNDVLRSGDAGLIADWRKLQTSDHVYYMSTKWLKDGDVHAYFSPYDSPYDAFLYFMNVIRDLRWRVMQHHHIGGLHG